MPFDLLHDLPEGFGRSDLHEAQMLEAALLGVPFEGNLSEMFPPVERPAPLPPSPSTLAAREIREQQDYEYEESQKLDREKRAAAIEQERQKREAAVLEAQRKQQEADSMERLLRVKRQALPSEPPENDLNSIVVVIRLPDGLRCRRRFVKSNPVAALFDFVDLEVNKDVLNQVQC